MTRSLAAPLLCLALLNLANPAKGIAQAPAAAEAKPASAPSLEIVIPEEPREIGAAGLLPVGLTRPITVDFQARPLAEFVTWLQDEQKLNVVVERSARRKLAEETITDHLKEEPLEFLLDRLELVGLGWFLEGEVLHLASLEEARSRVIVVRYNLGSLLDAGFEAERLIETIRKGTTGPWAGEEGGSGNTVLVGDVLFVKQHQKTQTEVAALLSAVAKHGRRTVLLDPPQHAALRTKLRQRISVNFDEIPLKDAIQQLGAKIGVELKISPELPRGVNLDREPVKAVIDDQDLESILAVISRTALLPEIRAGAVWVTSKASAVPSRLTAVYDVRDLCLDREESAALQEAIQSQVPGPWNQGKTTSGLITFPKPGILVVRQTLSGLDGISTMLEEYREALRVSKLREKEYLEPKKVELRLYRVPTLMADDAEVLLLELVAPQSWASVDPTQPGTIRKAPSLPRVLEAADPRETGKMVLSYSVLLIRQTMENHRAIAALLGRLEGGDPAPPPAERSGRKIGIGGFGRGYFPTKP